MNNKIFLDTSVLVEALKGNRRNFYYSLITNSGNVLCINSTVVSENFYYLIGLSGGSSPRSLQQSHKLKDILDSQLNQVNVLNDFQYAEPNETISTLVPLFIAKYNLLPNDAIILATCKIHNLTKLASHDTDFIIPCQQEGIELFTETA